MLSNLTVGDLMIDCAHAERTVDFYAGLTGWEKTLAYGCPALRTDNGLTVPFAEVEARMCRRFGPGNRASGKSKCTWTLRWTICSPPWMGPSILARLKPPFNTATGASLCLIRRGGRFACAAADIGRPDWQPDQGAPHSAHRPVDSARHKNIQNPLVKHQFL